MSGSETSVPHYLTGVTSPAMHERLVRRMAEDPSVRVIANVLKERFLEWAHSVGVATDPWLAECVPPIPPPALRGITAETDAAMFLFTGFLDVMNLVALYRQHAPALPPRPRVLDFGCGCGRMTRFLAPASWDISASEVNPDQVAWCRANLPGIETRQNGSAPPLRFDDAAFDFVYSLSVFSHLSAGMMDLWLYELARVTTPGGIITATFHGPHALRVISTSAEHRASTHVTREAALGILGRLEAERVILVPYPDDQLSVIKVGAPAYGLTFVDPRWALQLCSLVGLELLSHVAGGIRGFQDILVLRRRAIGGEMFGA